LKTDGPEPPTDLPRPTTRPEGSPSNPPREPSRREKALTKAKVPKEEKKYRVLSPKGNERNTGILQEEDEDMPMEEEEEGKEVIPSNRRPKRKGFTGNPKKPKTTELPTKKWSKSQRSKSRSRKKERHRRNNFGNENRLHQMHRRPKRNRREERREIESACCEWNEGRNKKEGPQGESNAATARGKEYAG
jgi:hypothetical protein